jgi:anti-sigma B factor antagonist
MQLDLLENGNVNVLVLSGQLTIGAEGQLSEAIDTLLESDRTSILLDLTRVSYMDSVGIGELVSSYRTVKRLGGALKILRPTKKVRDTLSLTQLLPIMEVFDDEETAVASFTSADDQSS